MPKRARSEQVLVVPPRHRVVRWEVDEVGNDLTAILRWCATHNEPVWQFGDGSMECPQTRLVGWDTGDHVFVDAPWEASEVGG